MRWLRRIFWVPFGILCRLNPLLPLHAVETEILDGVIQLRFENSLIRLLGRVGGYPYSVSYIVDGELMIDTGFPWARRSLRRYLIDSGLASSITAVLITHEHEDHFGNNDTVTKLTGAAIYAHPAAISEISHPWVGRWYRSFLFGPVSPTAVEPVPARISTARRSLEIIHTPGHTPGHVVAFDRERATLFSGDLFIDAELDAQLDDADGPAWLTSLHNICELSIEYLADGHGVLLEGADAEEALQSKRRFLNSMREAVAAQVSAGPRTVQEITRAIAQPGTMNYLSIGEGRMSALTGDDFSRSNLVRTFVRDLASQDASSPPAKHL